MHQFSWRHGFLKRLLHSKCSDMHECGVDRCGNNTGACGHMGAEAKVMYPTSGRPAVDRHQRCALLGVAPQHEGLQGLARDRPHPRAGVGRGHHGHPHRGGCPRPRKGRRPGPDHRRPTPELCRVRADRVPQARGRLAVGPAAEGGEGQAGRRQPRRRRRASGGWRRVARTGRRRRRSLRRHHSPPPERFGCRKSSNTEITPSSPARTRAVLAAFKAASDGEEPAPEEEVTGDQLAAFEHRLGQGAAPCPDFGVWSPFGQRLAAPARSRCTTSRPAPTTSRTNSPGLASPSGSPPTAFSWSGCGRSTPRPKRITMRSELMGRIRRTAEEELHAAVAAVQPHPFDPKLPCLKAAAQDRVFWGEELDRKCVLSITHLKMQKQLAAATGTSRRAAAPEEEAQPPGPAQAEEAEPSTASARARGPPKKRQRAADYATSCADAMPKRMPMSKSVAKANGVGRGKAWFPGSRYRVSDVGTKICWFWNHSGAGCAEVCANGTAHVCESCCSSRHRRVQCSHKPQSRAGGPARFREGSGAALQGVWRRRGEASCAPRRGSSLNRRGAAEGRSQNAPAGPAARRGMAQGRELAARCAPGARCSPPGGRSSRGSQAGGPADAGGRQRGRRGQQCGRRRLRSTGCNGTARTATSDIRPAVRGARQVQMEGGALVGRLHRSRVQHGHSSAGDSLQSGGAVETARHCWVSLGLGWDSVVQPSLLLRTRSVACFGRCCWPGPWTCGQACGNRSGAAACSEESERRPPRSFLSNATGHRANEKRCAASHRGRGDGSAHARHS